jgi:hypothetical protein
MMNKALRNVIVAIFVLGSACVLGPACHAATRGSTPGVTLTQADQKLQARITRELYHELMMPNRKFSPTSKSP